MSDKITWIGAAAMATLVVGIVAVLSSATCEVKFKTEKPNTEEEMHKVETNLDTVATLDMLYKLSAFIRAKATNPSQLKMETSISGEIELRMGSRTLVKAERDFFNEQVWSIEVVEELRAVIQPAKMF